VFADGGDVMTLSPHLSRYGDVGYLAQLAMALLVGWDRNNRPYPDLTTALPTTNNGGVSVDGKTITYRRRRGVVLSNGSRFSAADLAFHDPCRAESRKQ
jgi:peptide/nickel transport system substrate-binding protein